jgi:CheY-like chemotaxis protein
MHPEPNPAPAGLRVLVVEDNPVNQKILSMALQRMGCAVALAGNGQECLDAMDGQAFDIILMDLAMPVMDGLEATRRLRADGCRTPILVVSANAYPSDQEAAMAAGADGFLAKPAPIAGLRERILEMTVQPARAVDGP